LLVKLGARTENKFWGGTLSRVVRQYDMSLIYRQGRAEAELRVTFVYRDLYIQKI